MADQQARNLQYNYQQNSNLVLQVDRNLVEKRRPNEATGEVKSLVGRLSGSMGDRANRMSNKEKEEFEERKKKKVFSIEIEIIFIIYFHVDSILCSYTNMFLIKLRFQRKIDKRKSVSVKKLTK